MAKPPEGCSSKVLVNFSKLHGAQNDFIAIDNRHKEIQMTSEQRELMCARHLGVGADGLMEIHASDKADFKIVHFNADGATSSLCGNGLRCGLIFCRKIGIPMRNVKDAQGLPNGKVPENGVYSSSPEDCSKNVEKDIPMRNVKDAQGQSNGKVSENVGYSSSPEDCSKNVEKDIRRYGFPKSYYAFEAFDGIHFGALSETEDECFILFRPVDMAKIKRYENGDFFLDTGSPHHVRFVPSVDAVDAEAEGRPIRYGMYGDEGSNVNFVSKKRNEDCPEQLILQAKTYERGNEYETKACGTGAVAIAIADVINDGRLRDGTSLGVNSKNERDSSGVSQTIQKDAGKTERACGEEEGGSESERWFSRYIEMPGGMLRVYFRFDGDRVDSVWLQGPALCVMDGCYPLG